MLQDFGVMKPSPEDAVLKSKSQQVLVVYEASSY
jgi:hypothetical protein